MQRFFFSGSAIGDVNDTEKAAAYRSKETRHMAGEHYDLNFVKSAIRHLSVYGEVVSTTVLIHLMVLILWMLWYPSRPQVQIWLLRFMTERTSTVAPKLKL
ncbi:hypothetical protein VPH35_116672 [Triticum aestivum]|uniref:Uncharacterized protein n=1 Tax=Aegilops tauschii subsp. strangulata TaxID=200361 RepID=A0A453NQQ7_AEGTS